MRSYHLFIILIYTTTVLESYHHTQQDQNRTTEYCCAQETCQTIKISDLITTIIFCYLIGRQLRASSTFPNEQDTLLSVGNDLLFGFFGALWTTICHETGHAVAHRLHFGSWPDAIALGGSFYSSKTLVSFYNNRIRITGLDPLHGETTISKENLSKAPIHFFLAGSICGIIGYIAFSKILEFIYASKNGVSYPYILHLPVVLQFCNITCYAHEVGTDAYYIMKILMREDVNCVH